MARTTLTLLALLAAAPVSGQSATYQAPGAGKVQMRWGAPRYREALMSQARPGLIWRLGANGPTTLETTAALVFEKGAVFPGSYNLGAGKLGDDRWNLIFHRDGNMFRSGKSFGQFAMMQGRLEKKSLQTKALQLELYKHPDKTERKAGGAMFRVRFGPHQMTAGLRVIGVAKKRSKVGRAAYTVESLKLKAVPEYQKAIDGLAEEPLTLARITRAKDEASTLVALEPGEPPILKLVDWKREITGARRSDRSKAPKLKLTLGSKGIVIRLGPTEIGFELGDDTLRPSETGGRTGKPAGG